MPINSENTDLIAKWIIYYDKFTPKLGKLFGNSEP